MFKDIMKRMEAQAAARLANPVPLMYMAYMDLPMSSWKCFTWVWIGSTHPGPNYGDSAAGTWWSPPDLSEFTPAEQREIRNRHRSEYDKQLLDILRHSLTLKGITLVYQPKDDWAHHVYDGVMRLWHEGVRPEGWSEENITKISW